MVKLHRLRLGVVGLAAVVVLAACSQETPTTSMTPEELDAKAQRAAREQREIPVPEFARNARFYDLKKDHFRQLNFAFEPAQGSALAFYRDFFTGQGWQACQQPGAGGGSFIDMDGQRKQQRTAFFVKEAENRFVMVMEEMRPDIVPALLPDDVPDEIQASVAVYDVPSREDLALGLNMTGVACPGWQQK